MRLILFLLCLMSSSTAVLAQDTFSMVALDSVSGEVGSAGASCVDLVRFGLEADFLGQLFPGKGAINTQASYDPDNQANARLRLLAGDRPTEIIDWLIRNDVDRNTTIRQYGIVGWHEGHPEAAAHTGFNTNDYKGHRLGPNYAIQGNILSGPGILDSMEARFLRTSGSLADKLMAAMQGANVVGADSRCAGNQSSSLFAYLKVAKKTDPQDDPSLRLGVITRNGNRIEPIDSLQAMYDRWKVTTSVAEPARTKQLLPLSPNPAHNKLSIEIEGVAGKIVSLRLFEIHGKAVHAIDYELTNGRLHLQLTTISAGLYVGYLENEQGRRFLFKFVKF